MLNYFDSHKAPSAAGCILDAAGVTWAEVKTPPLGVTVCTVPELSACVVSKSFGAVVQLFARMGSVQLPKHTMAFEVCCRGSGHLHVHVLQAVQACRRPAPCPSGSWELGGVFQEYDTRQLCLVTHLCAVLVTRGLCLRC